MLVLYQTQSHLVTLHSPERLGILKLGPEHEHNAVSEFWNSAEPKGRVGALQTSGR